MQCSPPPQDSLAPELAALQRHPLALRSVRTARRLRRLDSARPMALDSLLALAVLAIGLADLVVHHGHPLGTAAPAALLVATVAGQAIPLVWRRRAPLGAWAAVLGCNVLQWSLGTSLHSATGLMIALYALTRYDRLKTLPWTALGTAGGITVAAFHAQPFAQQSWDSLFFLYSTATAAATMGLVVRVRRAQQSALADRAHRLEVEREQRVQLATLAERSRVSREMHDIVGHTLAVIIGLADGAAGTAATEPARSAEVLRIIAGTSRQALSELRRTLSALRERPGQRSESADLAPQPGIADLTALLQRTKAAGPAITYRTAGNLDDLPAHIQLAVYRIVQESLTNSLRHAGPATGVQVTLAASDQQVEVQIQDTGPPESAPLHPVGHPTREGSQNGQGLVGIAERAALTGGTAHAGPTDHGGWAVHATLPLPAPAHPDKEQP